MDVFRITTKLVLRVTCCLLKLVLILSPTLVQCDCCWFKEAALHRGSDTCRGGERYSLPAALYNQIFICDKGGLPLNQ
jgi:hypothetical protein